MRIEYKNLVIDRFEHDTIQITSTNSGVRVIFDPFQSEGSFKSDHPADIIMISHDHFDHFSPKDLTSSGDRQTQYVFPASILDKVQTFLAVREEQTLPVVPLEEYLVETSKGNVKCMPVPAYNIDKKSPQGNLYHPKDKAYVGYVVEIDGVAVYFSGDTDPIPEMKVLEGMIEVLLIPVSGVYVMTLEEAFNVTRQLSPALVIPMHYGSIVGDKELGESFANKIKEQMPHIKVAA